MNETKMFGTNSDQWVCPNDRQLALRAKLKAGWSVHTFRTSKQRKSQTLDQQELEIIASVIHRAEQLEHTEQRRIGRLVERLDNMRKSAMGNGLSQCLLCGQVPGLLGTPSVLCLNCSKKVCTKCGIETILSDKTQWLCKICSEQREVWKRSGAWFYNYIPKYVYPGKVGPSGLSSPLRGTQKLDWKMSRSALVSHTFTWAQGKVISSSSDSESDQSEGSEDRKVSRQTSGTTVRQASVFSSSPAQVYSACQSEDSLLSESHSCLNSDCLLSPTCPKDHGTNHSRPSII